MNQTGEIDPYVFAESNSSDETEFISPSVSSECGSDILKLDKETIKKFKNDLLNSKCIMDPDDMKTLQEEFKPCKEPSDLSWSNASSGSIYVPSDKTPSSEPSDTSLDILSSPTINRRPLTTKNTESTNITHKVNEPISSSLFITPTKDLCPFCYEQVGHFSRHLERIHSDEETVKKIMKMPLKSTHRRNAIILLRRKGNFVLKKERDIIKPIKRPSRINPEPNNIDYSVCVNCLGFIKSTYLARHRKSCKANAENFPKRYRFRSEAQTFLVGTGLLGNYLNKSRLLDVFKIMRADEVGLIAKSDPLICLYGESILGKHKRKQMYTCVSQKMRNMAKLLITLKKLTTVNHFHEILKPEFYNYIIAATKEIGGYDPKTLTMESASLALHMSTDFKHLCKVAKKAITTKDPLIGKIENTQEKRLEIEQLIEMIESHWCHDIGSLAYKVLNENKIENPKLLPTAEDVFKFNTFTSSIADEAYNKILNNEHIEANYDTLAKCTLALLLLFNRRRIGEIQFLDIKTYERPTETFNQEEMLSCLTEFEKSLCKMFKRVIVFGKGSKPVPILFSKITQKYTDLIIHLRQTTNIVPKENQYVFALSASTRWINGSAVIQKLSRECGAKQPELLRSTRFRKQIATILQIMNFGQDELTQIAKFMGHTEKTHVEFYRLTENTYQTAKVAKVLLLLESGRGAEFKGKSLDEITLNEEELIELDSNEQPGPSGALQNEKNIKFDQHTDETTVNKEVAVTRKEKSKGRIKWKAHQKKIVLDTFKRHIKTKVAPKKDECLQFIKDNPEFQEFDWVRIKTLIFNTYRCVE